MSQIVQTYSADIYSLMSDSGRLIEIKPRTDDLYILPTWGFLEAIEIRFTPPIVTMDFNNELRCILEFEARVRDFRDRA